ncbi:hypothetical protein H4R19_005649, partial [Coemansia spiralis]
MFGKVYQHIVAELSDEEAASVWALVKSNRGHYSTAQLLDQLVAEHPLCLRSDLAEALMKCTAHLHRSKEEQPTQVPPQPALTTSQPRPMRLAVGGGQHQWPVSPKSPQGPGSPSVRKTNVRWTPKE